MQTASIRTRKNSKSQVYAVGCVILAFKSKKNQERFECKNALIDELLVKKCKTSKPEELNQTFDVKIYKEN